MSGASQHKLVKHYGLNPGLANRLDKAGYPTPKLVRAASDAELMEIPGVGPRTVDEIREKVG